MMSSPVPSSNSQAKPFRLAWFGGVGEGGVPAMARLYVKGLLDAGVEIDMYVADTPNPCLDSLRSYPNLKVVTTPSWWKWNKWYSKTAALAFVSGTFSRVREHIRLTRLLIETHRARCYDCVFQISQTELFEMGKRLNELPPVVVHPCTHAKGELRWHRAESAYALKSESRLSHYVTRFFLAYRARNQAGELRKPALVIGPSNQFVGHLVSDYKLDPKRMEVLRHPIILPSYHKPLPPREDAPDRPVRLLFASRISVRKGFEMIAALSHRLNDLAGRVTLDVAGARTLWSDYTKHLNELNPTIATYLGNLAHHKMLEAYDSSDALIVPSHYEPGSLVVGEALSRGLPIIASEAVGPVEVLSPPACRTFPQGDLDALEQLVRELIDELRRPGMREAIAQDARAQAQQLFAPEVVTGRLLALLKNAAGTG